MPYMLMIMIKKENRLNDMLPSGRTGKMIKPVVRKGVCFTEDNQIF